MKKNDLKFIMTMVFGIFISYNCVSQPGPDSCQVTSSFNVIQNECNNFTFQATSTSNSETAIVIYKWDFGDGTFVDTFSTSISHTYSSNGSYTVKLTTHGETTYPGTVPYKCQDTAQSQVNVNCNNCQVTSSFNVIQNGCDNFTFQATSTSNSETAIVLYKWDFGDGTFVDTFSTSASHTYNSDGNYTVKLTTLGETTYPGTVPYKCQDTAQSQVNVSCGGPDPNICNGTGMINHQWVNTCPDNQIITHTAYPIMDSGWSVTEYEWSYYFYKGSNNPGQGTLYANFNDVGNPSTITIPECPDFVPGGSTDTYCNWKAVLVIKAKNPNSRLTCEFTIEDGAWYPVSPPCGRAFSYYPSPAKENITISLERATSLRNTASQIVVYDLMGELVKEKSIIIGEENLLDTSNLESGVYIIQLKQGNEILETKKLIVKK